MSIIGNIGGQSGGGSLTKSILIVTAPTGSTVTVTKGDTTKTAMEKNGEWWFKNLENGEWTIRATLGGRNDAIKYTITQFGVYRVRITYFHATVNVTYLPGTNCTATDGTTTVHAPDTSGTWTCDIQNAGDWTFSDGVHPYDDVVTISEKEQTEAVDITRYWLYRNGNQYVHRTGGYEKLRSSKNDNFSTLDNLLTVTVDKTTSGGGATTIAAKNAIDIAKFSKLSFNMYVANYRNDPGSYPGQYSASAQLLSTSGAVISQSYTTKGGDYGLVRVDIGAAAGMHKIGANVVGGYNAGNTMKIKEIWCEA